MSVYSKREESDWLLINMIDQSAYSKLSVWLLINNIIQPAYSKKGIDY